MHLVSRTKLDVLAVVLDLLDLGRLIRDMPLAIPHLGAVRPRCVPQSVHDVHVLVSDLVPLVVRHQLPAERVGRRLRPARHHVPGDPASGQVIQRAERPGQGERRDVAGASRQAKGYRFGDGLQVSVSVSYFVGSTYSHGRDNDQGIELSHLHAGTEHGVHVTAVHVVSGIRVGEEDRRDACFLSHLGHFNVVLEAVLGLGVIPRPRPLACALVISGACRLEKVQVNPFPTWRFRAHFGTMVAVVCVDLQHTI